MVAKRKRNEWMTYSCRCCAEGDLRFGDERHWTPSVGLASKAMYFSLSTLWFPFRFYCPAQMIAKIWFQIVTYANWYDCTPFLREKRTWFDARNSSTLFAFSRDLTSVTITGGLMKFVSTFSTLSVSLFSMASANCRAHLSVSPTFVSERTSRCSLLFNAFNNCSNFSSEIF